MSNAERADLLAGVDEERVAKALFNEYFGIERASDPCSWLHAEGYEAQEWRACARAALDEVRRQLSERETAQ